MSSKAPGKDASAITLDPHLRLGAAVVTKALADLYEDDLLKSLDALSWFLGDATFWLRCLGFEDDPDKVFQAILEDGYVKRGRFIRLAL
jgi:hypothetical protein